jgi:molybdopterin-binding protein
MIFGRLKSNLNVFQFFQPLEEIMALSARNVLKGKIKDLKKGPIMAEITVEVASGVDVVSAITANSVDRLGLAVGKDVEIVIKATSVMINA